MNTDLAQPRAGIKQQTVTALAAGTLSLALAACGGTAATSEAPSVSEEAPPSSLPSAASVTSSQDEAGSAGTLCAVGREPCALDAGTYTAAPFEPNFTFTVDDGWSNDRAFADGGGISKEIGGIYWASGVSRGTVGGEEVEVGATVDEFVAFLAALEAAGMTVSQPEDVEIDGAAGTQVDVESNQVEAPGLFFLDEDAFHLVPDEKARFMVVDKDGETVIFILDAFASSDFEAWIETAQPVMDTVTWE